MMFLFEVEMFIIKLVVCNYSVQINRIMSNIFAHTLVFRLDCDFMCLLAKLSNIYFYDVSLGSTHEHALCLSTHINKQIKKLYNVMVLLHILVIDPLALLLIPIFIVYIYRLFDSNDP